MKYETRSWRQLECSFVILPIKGCSSSKQLFKRQTTLMCCGGVGEGVNGRRYDVMTQQLWRTLVQ